MAADRACGDLEIINAGEELDEEGVDCGSVEIMDANSFVD